MINEIKYLFKDIDFNTKGIGQKIKKILNNHLEIKKYIENELKKYPMYDSYYYFIRTIIDNIKKDKLIKCKACRKSNAC